MQRVYPLASHSMPLNVSTKDMLQGDLYLDAYARCDMCQPTLTYVQHVLPYGQVRVAAILSALHLSMLLWLPKVPSLHLLLLMVSHFVIVPLQGEVAAGEAA